MKYEKNHLTFSSNYQKVIINKKIKVAKCNLYFLFSSFAFGALRNIDTKLIKIQPAIIGIKPLVTKLNGAPFKAEIMYPKTSP